MLYGTWGRVVSPCVGIVLSCLLMTKVVLWPDPSISFATPWIEQHPVPGLNHLSDTDQPVMSINQEDVVSCILTFRLAGTQSLVKVAQIRIMHGEQPRLTMSCHANFANGKLSGSAETTFEKRRTTTRLRRSRASQRSLTHVPHPKNPKQGCPS